MTQVDYSNVSAAIYGCAGLSLTDDEKAFFAEANPFGFILFARNCESPDQVKALTDDMHEVAGRENLPILIDQEGGRVARLKPPHWRKYPSAQTLAALAKANIEDAKEAIFSNAQLIAQDLRAVGITVNCAPLADIPIPEADAIIGDRAFGDEPHQVSILARAQADGLTAGGVIPILKHIPGHGRALVDSHLALPEVATPLDELAATDFVPFHQLNSLPMGMTAHVKYTALDAQNVATLSPTVIDYIRTTIGFDGLLMSDDVSMKALRGDIGELSSRIIDAGCDVVLHCNGDMQEMRAIAAAIGPMSDLAQQRAARAMALLDSPIAPADEAAMVARMETLLPDIYAA